MTTATGAVRNRAPSADAERQAGIERLARDCETSLYGDVIGYLARWCHPSLSPDRQVAMFELYRDSLERQSAIRDGVADWTEELPGMTDGNCLEMAVETFGDRAREALFVLVHGEVAT